MAEGDFHKERCIVERTNEAEIGPEEQNEKTESCQKNLWNEIQLKRTSRQKQTQERNKKKRASSVGLCQRHTLKHPHHVKVSPWGLPGDGGRIRYQEMVVELDTRRWW